MDDTWFLNFGRSKDSDSTEENDPDDSEDEDDHESEDSGTYTVLGSCDHHADQAEKSSPTDTSGSEWEETKLKSFGPVICWMAMLIHIRSGSFFFKALGITLLFLAGFPNDHHTPLGTALPRTLHECGMLCAPDCLFILFAGILLTIFLIFWAQKILLMLSNHLHICRADEDAEREELFLSLSETDAINISDNSEKGRKASTKTKSKREAISKSKTSDKVTTIHSEPSCSAPPSAPFGLMEYASSPS